MYCPLPPTMVSPFFQDVLCLVLLSALAAIESKKININDSFGSFAEKVNTWLRERGMTTAPLPAIPLGPWVKYSDAVLLGLDSLQRTGDCWHEKNGNDIIVDVNYGLHLMAIVLPSLVLEGKNMSAFARVRENSIHLSYTLHLSGGKCLTLNELRVVKLENVAFGTSIANYDGSDVEGLFRLVVRPTLNGIVKSNLTNIEATLQAVCKVHGLPNRGRVQEHVMSFV